MTPTLEFCNVWKGYETGLVVLRGLSFALHCGEIALLIGENGAGKTTAFDIACGNQIADRGAVSIHGLVVAGRSPDAIARMGVRRMYQFPTIFQSLSIRDNILIGVRPQFYSSFRPWPFCGKRRQMWDEVQDLSLPLFRSCSFLRNWRTLAGDLSFGQQRVVDFLRVIANSRRDTVLLLDEPFAGIHRDLAEIMWAMVCELAPRGATVLVVEHENDVGRFNGMRRLRLCGGSLQCVA